MSSPVENPIRAQLIEARRAQILDAASVVFAEKGFHLTTTKEIAQAAGISEGTIYNYFKNKDDLLVAMIRRLAEINQLSAQVVQATAGADAEQILRLILTNRFDLLERNRTQVQALLPQVISNPGLRRRFFKTVIAPIMTTMEQAFQGMIADGRIRAVDPQVAVHAISAMVMGLLVLNIVGDTVISKNRNKFLAGVMDLLLNGLQGQPELAKDG